MSQQHVPIQHHTKESSNIIVKLQRSWNKYQKQISTIGIGILCIGLIWWGYYKYVYIPKEEKANSFLYQPQQFFAIDSFQLALNGSPYTKGFRYIIRTFPETKAANLSKYYAGICCLQLRQPAEAVNYLKEFYTHSKQIQLLAYGLLGDAYSEIKNNKMAIESYAKAGHHFPQDDINSSEYLFRAGLLSEIIGNKKEALDFYKEIKTEYPKTDRGFQIDKYIYRIQPQGSNDLN